MSRIAVVLALFALALPALAADPAPDHVTYVPRYEDPVLKELENRDKERAKAEADATGKIRERQKTEAEAKKGERKTLRFDLSKLPKPANPQAFKQAFHFPPVAQYLTNTCWSFSTTSFYESEVARLTGKKIQLSSIYTVYFEYLDKIRRFVAERGASLVEEGSESNALKRVWKEHGIVPLDQCRGYLGTDERHDHSRLIDRIHQLLDYVKANDLWDEAIVTRMARAILDSEIGAPPEKVTWEGTTYTPQAFLSKVLTLNLDDYVEFQSTLAQPFWKFGEYAVPDNWWHDKSYCNVPLPDWYAALKKAVTAGYTVAIGGDVSEPGLNGFEGVAVVPTFDIPGAFIDQDSREFRIENRTTDDDHGIHIVGITQVDGHDWFLVKDSNRSSRWGKYPGYYFYRDDYVKLKMLTFAVHRSAVPELVEKCK